MLLLTSITMGVHAQKDLMASPRKPKPKKSFIPVNQKVPATDRRVETLSIRDRIALRTNVMDWALMIPNIGAEFDVKNTNWNRWTVGFNVRYNWQTSHTYTHFLVYNFFQARLEARQYWRTRRIGDKQAHSKEIEHHTKIWDKAISIRRSKVKHPTTTWYRGFFVAYNSYSFLIPNRGHQGHSYMVGVCYGLVRPLFGFNSGNSLDFELGISGGLVYYKDDVYQHDQVNDRYFVTESKPAKWLPYPMLNEIRLGLVYRIGHEKSRVLAKYRYRRDVDVVYDKELTEYRDSVLKAREDARNYHKNYTSILQKFWHVYDSIAGADKEKHFMMQNAAMKTPADTLKAEKGKKEDKPKEKKSKKDKKQKKSAAQTGGSDAQKGGDDA